MARNEFMMPGDLAYVLTLATFPGMIPEESRPLRAFLAKHGAQFDAIRFRVMLGDGMAAEDGDDPAVAAVVATWGTLRPDLVAFKYPNEATIIEAKQAFGSDAVWQLQAYRDAYRRAFPDHRIRLVGVGEFANDTARGVARSAGVALYVYAFPPGPPDVTAQPSEDSSDVT